jgi:hypothetical protein
MPAIVSLTKRHSPAQQWTRRRYLLIAIALTLCACEREAPSIATGIQEDTPQPATSDGSVFGVVTLGRRLDFPMCASAPAGAVCNRGRLSGGAIAVRIPALQTSARYQHEIYVQEIDGAAHVVLVRAADHAGTDDEMRSDMVEHYGEPTSIGRYDDDVEWARWSLPGLDIEWVARGPSSDAGMALMSTPKGSAAMAAEIAASEAKEPKP